MIGPEMALAAMLELNDVKAEFQKRTGATSEIAEVAADHYHRFMVVHKDNDMVLVPSELMDEFWHIHLENEEAYAKYSNLVAGRVVTHTPGGEPELLAEGWSNTINSFDRHFGIKLAETSYTLQSNVGSSDDRSYRSNVASDCF